MERLDRNERVVIAILFWPLTVALTAIVAVTAIAHEEAVLVSARNPLTLVLFLIWLALLRRMVRRGRNSW